MMEPAAVHIKDVNHLERIMQLELKNIQLQLDNATEKAVYQNKLNELHFAKLNDEYTTIKDMKTTFVSAELFNAKETEISKRLTSVERIVYIGLGALATIQIVVQFLGNT